MALKVGELFATMRLDNKGFDTALDKSGQKFTALGNAMGKGVQAVSRVFAATTVAAAGLGIAALKVGLDYNRMQQTSRAALLTILGSTEAVNEQMAKLDEFASKSPFSKQVFLQAQQQMLGFGIETQKVIPYLDAIQNSVAAVGGSNEDIAEIVNIFSKIQGASKITSQNLNELGYRGIDAASIIGEAMGKTGEEIRSEISSGSLDAGAALDALAAGMTAQFGGATDNIKQQMDGAADRVKAAWRDIGSVMATPLIDPTSGGQLVVWTNLFADGLRQIQKQAEPVTAIIWGRLGPGIEFVTAGMKQANAAIAGWNAKSLESSLDKLSGYAPLIAGTSAALFAMGTTNLPVLSALGITGINPVVAGVAALVATSPALRQVGLDFLAALEPAIQPAQQLVTIIADFLMSALDAVTPALGDVATAGANVGVAFMQGLVPAFQLAADLTLPVVQGTSDLVSTFAKLPTPLLAAVGAFTAMKALGLGGVFTTLGVAAKGSLQPLGGYLDTARLQMMYLREGSAGLTAAMAPLKGAISGVGVALKTAFMANAPLIAITALVTVLGAMAQAKAEATQKINDFKASLDAATGAVTENTRELAVNELKASGALDAYTRLGGKLSDLTDAALGERDALETVNGVLDEHYTALTENQAAAELMGTGTSGLTEKQRELNAAVGTVRASITDTNGVLNAAQSAHEQHADAMGGSTAAAEANAEAMRRAAAAADTLRSAEQSLAAAKGSLVVAQYAATDALEEWTAKTLEAGGVQRDANGALVESGDAWRQFETGAIRSRDAISQVAENMVKAGASQDEVDAKVLSLKESFLSQAESMGVSREEAEAYLEAIGGIPEVKATTAKLDADAAYSDLEALVNDINTSDGFITIDATNDPAVARLVASLGLVDDGTGVFTIDADDNPAITQLLASLGIVDTSEGVITIDGQDEEAMRALAAAVAAINDGEGTVSILGRNMSRPVLDEVKRNINNSQGWVKIYGTDYATGLADTIVRNINGKVAYLKIHGVRVGQGAGGTGGLVPDAADGGIFNVASGIQSFGHGGIRALPSQAEITAAAGAGLIRYAEAETEGEGFVPLAASKRARSLAIMDEIAARFGYVMVKRSDVTSRADGGVSGSSVAQGQPFTTIGAVNLNVDVRDVEELVRASDALDALFLMLRMRGVPVHG